MPRNDCVAGAAVVGNIGKALEKGDAKGGGKHMRPMNVGEPERGGDHERARLPWGDSSMSSLSVCGALRSGAVRSLF